MSKQSYKVITLADGTRHRAISCPTRKTIPSASSGISKGTVKAPEVKLTRSQKKLRREQARIMREAQFATREYPKGKGQRSGTLSSSYSRALDAKSSKSTGETTFATVIDGKLVLKKGHYREKKD